MCKKKNSLLKVVLLIAGGFYLGKKASDYTRLENPEKIQSIYRLWSKFYDPFLRAWNKSIARKAEQDLNEFLEKNFAEKSIKVLDLACGTGQNIERLKHRGIKVAKYIGVDLSEAMQAKAKEKAVTFKNKEFHIENVYNFQTEEKFDLIICTWALSHLKDEKKFIEKYKKMLNKGGYFVLIFQGEFKQNIWLNIALKSLENWLQASLVKESVIKDIGKGAFINNEYFDSYVRLLIFKS